jgi:hypothetical protein
MGLFYFFFWIKSAVGGGFWDWNEKYACFEV